ncbi:hypothetical protein E5676_scaffold384G002060 [Cucumis melo var. makuwa]|uniref:Uncharacterized protein n=1 Tax=Cucumis melo var. makuwa TaxID=1194695 RepID=A0A5A7VM49_CUCMM|nr:hypothetical protein E6C27_scaffold271G002130 [Cucumis melo var. makuwa]TYK27993.1 hypothetical protein E5676_scaffold384G002060 [Cucumis melo var. makuwa]
MFGQEEAGTRTSSREEVEEQSANSCFPLTGARLSSPIVKAGNASRGSSNIDSGANYTIGSSKKRGSSAPRKGLREIEVEILIGLP